MAITNFNDINIKSTFIVGSTAGEYTLTGITTADAIRSVYALRIGTDGTATTASDLTSEFSISAADTITNASGTNATDAFLNVLWVDKDET